MGGSKVFCSWRYESGSLVGIHKINNLYMNLPVDSHQSTKASNIVIAKGDSGATNHY